MHPRILIAVVAALAAGALATARADELPEAPAEACRTATVPAHVVTTRRQVVDPPVTTVQRVPVWETVEVPTYASRTVPVYRTVEVPVYETKEVPVYETERVPVWGEQEVPVYRYERKPVTISLWNPFACRCEEIELWDRCQAVPAGTQTVPAVVGHEEHQVQTGTRLERVQTGSRSEQVLDGERVECVPTGTRTERRCVGYEDRTVVVTPAVARTVEDREVVPARCVTVVPDGTTRSEPLPGTAEVLTESQYRDALAEATPGS